MPNLEEVQFFENLMHLTEVFLVLGIAVVIYTVKKYPAKNRPPSTNKKEENVSHNLPQ